MALTHDITTSIKNNNGAIVASARDQVTGATELEFSVAAAASANTAVALAIDVSELKSFWVKTDKAITLKTNSTSSPAQTIAIAAGIVFNWHFLTGGAANPLTTDVTVLYVVNGAGAVANVSGAFLLT